MRRVVTPRYHLPLLKQGLVLLFLFLNVLLLGTTCSTRLFSAVSRFLLLKQLGLQRALKLVEFSLQLLSHLVSRHPCVKGSTVAGTQVRCT